MFIRLLLPCILLCLSVTLPARAAVFDITTASPLTFGNTTLSALDGQIDVAFGGSGADNRSGSITTTLEDNGEGSRSGFLDQALTVVSGGESLTNTARFRFATANNAVSGSVIGASALIELSSVDAFVFSFGTLTFSQGIIGTTNCFGCTVGESITRPFVTLRASLSEPSVVPLPAGLPLILTGFGAFYLMRRRTTL